MELRGYQEQAIDAVLNALKEGQNRIYIKIATGGGKTFITKCLVDALLKNYDIKILFVVPKNILLTQTEKVFGGTGVYNSELKRWELGCQVTVASIQSIARVKELPLFNLVIFDEVHRAARQHVKFFKRVKDNNPKAKLVGLTATDSKIDKNLEIKKVFDCGLKKLTDEGYLCPVVVSIGKDKLDVSKMRVRGGEYLSEDISAQLTDEKIEKQVLDMVSRTGDRKFVIIMCTTIAHAEQVNAILLTGFLYHSRLNSVVRNENLDKWKCKGGYLVSVVAASEGFDFPPADCLVMFRATRSPILYEQSIGRIARKSPGKTEGLFLDYGGVIDSLGLPYEITQLKRGEIKHKECDECSAALSLNASECTACGYVFMTPCLVCGEFKPYGQTCCRQERDMLKATKVKPFEKKDPWVRVSDVTLHKHVSKKGNECLKVVYWQGIFNSIHKEYFLFTNKEFKQFREALFRDFKSLPLELVGKKPIDIPSHILLQSDGKYKKVQSMKFKGAQ